MNPVALSVLLPVGTKKWAAAAAFAKMVEQFLHSADFQFLQDFYFPLTFVQIVDAD